MGLYQENVSESSEQPTPKQPLTTMTNVDLVHRNKDFGSQFDMTDSSPVLARTAPREEKAVDSNRAKVLKGLNANWGAYDESPEQQEKKENIHRGKANTSSGMGNRKDTNARHWGFDDEEQV